jgi:hypothetical protein
MSRITATEESIDGVADLLCSVIYSKDEVRRIVRFEIKQKLRLQFGQGYRFGIKSENREYAEDVADLAGQLLKKIERMPRGSRDALMILASQGEPERWSLYDAKSPAVKAFREKLHKVLAGLRNGCEAILVGDVGDDKKRDRPKEICAGCALDLYVGLDAGKPTIALFTRSRRRHIRRHTQPDRTAGPEAPMRRRRAGLATDVHCETAGAYRCPVGRLETYQDNRSKI